MSKSGTASGGAGLQQLGQLVQPPDGFVVVGFQVFRIQRHIHDEHDLLPEVVKGDDLIEEHQVHILEVLGVLGLGAGFRFAVAQIIVGEVPHQTAREGGEVLEPRAFVLRQDLPQDLRGVPGLKGQLPGLHHAVPAGDLHLRVQAQEGVPAPLFAGLGAFQQVAVGGNVFQDLQRPDGGADVR